MLIAIIGYEWYGIILLWYGMNGVVWYEWCGMV